MGIGLLDMPGPLELWDRAKDAAGRGADWVREQLPPIPSPGSLISGTVDSLYSKPEQPPDPKIVGASGDTSGSDLGGAAANNQPSNSYSEASQQPNCIASSGAGPSNRMFSIAANTFDSDPPADPVQPDSYAEELWNEGFAPRPNGQASPAKSAGNDGSSLPSGPAPDAAPDSPTPEQRAETPTRPGIRNPNNNEGNQHDTIPDPVPNGVNQEQHGLWTPEGEEQGLKRLPGSGRRPNIPGLDEILRRDAETWKRTSYSMAVAAGAGLAAVGTAVYTYGPQIVSGLGAFGLRAGSGVASVGLSLWNVTKKSMCESDPGTQFCISQGNGPEA